MFVVVARVAAADEPEATERLDPGTPRAPSVVTGAVQLVRTDATWHYQVIPAGTQVAAPPAWPYDVAGSLRGKGLLRPKDPSKVAALFAVTTFTLGPERQGLGMLEIRLRYRDGCAIWLDGIELARRELPRDGSAAPRKHGSEWETFYVPVAPGLLRLGENVLAVEVRPIAKRDVPELAADVIGRREFGIVRGPIVSDVAATTATIAVDTDPGIAAVLEWGHAAADHSFAHHVDSPPARHHVFALDGLPPRARIAYRVHAGATVSKTFTFHTVPDPGATIRIGVYGDVRGGHGDHHRLVSAMLGEGFDLVAVTGDMVLHGSDEGDWQQFFAITSELLAQVRYLPAVGNHDLGWDDAGDSAHRADDVFALPPGPPDRPERAYWYSADLADVHLVFLDSNAYERPEQERWLDADLAAARARKVRAIIALTHDGPYARGLHRGNRLAKDHYVPILARYHVDLLLSGHDHLYQRGDIAGIHYIVSGGGGAGLYQVSCGVDGKRDCPEDGMQQVIVEHHYIALTIDKRHLEMCPRRGDGSLLEPCVRYRLH